MALPPGNYPRAVNHGLDWKECHKLLAEGVKVWINELVAVRAVLVAVEPDDRVRTVWRVWDGNRFSFQPLLETEDVSEAVLFLMSCWDNAEDQGMIADWYSRPR